MDKGHEEDMLRITERYVAEVQAGSQPHLSDYLLQYPQYADAIIEFVTYYHAFEGDLPSGNASTHVLPPLSETSQEVLERAWERITAYNTGSASPGVRLLAMAKKRGLSLSQLADTIGLSGDIFEKLTSFRIDIASVPQEVFRRLALTLQQPQWAIRSCFERPGKVLVAEARAPYGAAEQSATGMQSFREAVEQSLELPEEQKAGWREILAQAGF